MKAIVDEAHMYGMKVHAHAEGIKSVRAAVEVGVDTIEHGDILDERVCEKMVRKNIILVPTISVYYVGPWAAWEDQQKSFNIARKAGVKIALGSDAFVEDWTPYGEYNIGEIKKLVDWGLSPMEAIMSATKIASEALGVENLTGTLEKGKSADILLVEGNPLEDITVLLNKKNIKKIIKEGKNVKRL
jgi:imidazolonepropionase-like amidohydrolase